MPDAKWVSFLLYLVLDARNDMLRGDGDATAWCHGAMCKSAAHSGCFCRRKACMEMCVVVCGCIKEASFMLVTACIALVPQLAVMPHSGRPGTASASACALQDEPGVQPQPCHPQPYTGAASTAVSNQGAAI